MPLSRVPARMRLSPQANNDISKVLVWSEEQFGHDAALRYAELIIQALGDLEADPGRVGVRQRSDLPIGVYSYHLVASRDSVPGSKVMSPRHFLIFRQLADDMFEVLRILHESRDLARHLPRK